MMPRVVDNRVDVAKRVLVLVDGLHTVELIGAVGRVLPLQGADVLLVYVHAAATRAGLEMAGHRPGGHRLPPHRVREVEEAEHQSGARALAEAAAAVRDVAETVELSELRGEAGKLVCESAARWLADVVVVRAGGPDRPPVAPASLGPAARFITDHAPCAVVVLR